MPTEVGQSSRSVSRSSLGLIFPILVVLSVTVLVAPVPPIALDLLLAANVTASVLILLTTISVRKPLDFNGFPSLLLLATLVRLVLNVASTRLILTRAHVAGIDAAGSVIKAFGQFVAQGQLGVGLILFAIVVVIQFVVITKGSTRISEVAARFALDGMPGKQLAIDADVAAGLLTSDEARARRAEISDQADFYAAMDGAGKFVRGDAIAGILIVLINLIGGLAIGMVQHHMTGMRAVEVFATLTIGDGLVSQIPSFLIAVAAGLLTTRSSRDSDFSNEVIRQTFRDPMSLFLAAVFACGLAFTGLPMLPLLALGLGCAYLGVRLQSDQRGSAPAVNRSGIPSKEVENSNGTISSPMTGLRTRPIRPEDKLAVEPIELELGFRLIKLADPDTGGDLMDRVTQLRNKIAQELGIILPKVKIRDSLRLNDFNYQIKLRETSVASGELRLHSLLAINPGIVSGNLVGDDFVEPATGRQAKWIEPSVAEHAKSLGYKVVEPAVVLISHLAEIVKTHADELLTRQQFHQLVDNLRTTSPKVVEELIPDLLKPSHLHQILCNLLRERVPVRDLETILQTLGDHADRVKDLGTLTEYARHALSRTICQQYRDSNKILRAVTLDPALEEVFGVGLEQGEQEPHVTVAPDIIKAFVQELTRHTDQLTRAGNPAVVICGPNVRRLVKQITRAKMPRLAILSISEITQETFVQSQGHVTIHAVKKQSIRHASEPLKHHVMAAAIS